MMDNSNSMRGNAIYAPYRYQMKICYNRGLKCYESVNVQMKTLTSITTTSHNENYGNKSTELSLVSAKSLRDHERLLLFTVVHDLCTPHPPPSFFYLKKKTKQNKAKDNNLGHLFFIIYSLVSVRTLTQFL